MPLWKVGDEEVVELRDWGVFEIPSLDQDGRDRHFVGSTDLDPGRVSSRIVSFDPETMIGVTRSGRQYRLVGNPGVNSDGRYVWANWMGIMKASDPVNVTNEYLRP
jgi:hypothetical protein